MASQQVKNATVAIVGGGLAGLSAAIEASTTRACKVILMDKQPRLGGNSAKASSGISVVTPSQNDSVQAFFDDVIQSGGGLSQPDLVQTLVEQSESALDWLIAQGSTSDPPLDLSLLSRCGGHTYTRTHRCPPRPDGTPVPVGFTLVNVLKQRVEALDIELWTHTTVNQLATDESGRIIGLDVTRNQGKPQHVPADAIILTSGGFGGQTHAVTDDPQQQPTWISQVAPTLVGFATTNGPWAVGDGIRLGQSVGAATRDMGQVQIHPTGFIDPDNPGSGSKMLAPEALRAHGAILLDREGHRFVDELTTRDKLTKAILEQNITTTQQGPMRIISDMPVAFLVLPLEAAMAFGKGAIDFYASKRLFVAYQGLSALASGLNVPTSQLQEVFADYNDHLAHNTPDPVTGKTLFPCPLPLSDNATYWVAMITPCVHYTMGGLSIDIDAAVLHEGSLKRIPGLYAAGEVTGGIHGRNRLAGVSLLECVVFGRRAGIQAATWAASYQR